MRPAIVTEFPDRYFGLLAQHQEGDHFFAGQLAGPTDHRSLGDGVVIKKHAFDLGYRRCEWKCDDLNEPSKSAGLRLGFRYEGTFRKATHYKGRNRDTAWFAVTDDDWPHLRESFEAWLSEDNFDENGLQIESLRALRGED